MMERPYAVCGHDHEHAWRNSTAAALRMAPSELTRTFMARIAQAYPRWMYAEVNPQSAAIQTASLPSALGDSHRDSHPRASVSALLRLPPHHLELVSRGLWVGMGRRMEG
jgi:hypothetical protein